MQARGHLFKVCSEWKAQQKVLWAHVWGKTGRGKSLLTIRNLLVDGRCSQAVLDFPSTTDVGRMVPAEEDAGSEVSEWVLWEREEGSRTGAEELGAAGELGAGGGELPLF